MLRTSLLSALLLLTGQASAQDRAGADHPLVMRYDGATIMAHRAPSLDEITVPTGPVTDEDAPDNLQRFEGMVTHIDYRVDPATAPLQIARFYSTQLADAGFEPVFSCAGPDCGRDMGSLILNSGKVAPQGLTDGVFNDRIRLIVARRGDDWVLLHIAEGPDRSVIYQAVVEGGVGAGS